jgi:hypothetical protein
MVAGIRYQRLKGGSAKGIWWNILMPKQKNNEYSDLSAQYLKYTATEAD